MRSSTLLAAVLVALAAFTTTANAAPADNSGSIAPQVHPCGPGYPACAIRCRKGCRTWSPEDCAACWDGCGCDI